MIKEQPTQRHALTDSERATQQRARRTLDDWLVHEYDKRAVQRCGFVLCDVDWHAGSSILVTFVDDSTLLLQSDYDQAGFAQSCGLFSLDVECDGVDHPDWEDCDPTVIWYCPGDYYELATKEGE